MGEILDFRVGDKLLYDGLVYVLVDKLGRTSQCSASVINKMIVAGGITIRLNLEPRIPIKTHQHEYKKYTGLTERYNYCECGHKTPWKDN